MEDAMTICNNQPGNDPLAAYNLPRSKPLWLHNAYAEHIVKGNFMTLSARPKTVEPGEWIAHQGMPLAILSIMRANFVISSRTLPEYVALCPGHSRQR